MTLQNKLTRIITILFSSLIASTAMAQTFNLPSPSESLIGEVDYISTPPNENAPIFAHQHGIGHNALIAANPGLNEDSALPGGYVTVPTEFMLPPLPREGIVINLPEMRMYYYPKNGTVMTFPVGIGKMGKTIPITNTYISRKVVNPSWTPTESIRQFDREQGIELPRRMGPGPDNPLGPYAIYLGVPTYLIHSTIFPESIGRRASFGCIRMNEDDIKEFFPLVQPRIPVAIINMPIKVAWQDDALYLESHPALEEHSNGGTESAVSAVEQALPQNQLVFVNWQLVAFLAEKPDGIPHEVGVRVN